MGGEVLPLGKRFYIVGLAAIIWATWKIRNGLCYAVVFLHYWAGLQKEEDRGMLEAGVAVMQANAVALQPEQEPVRHQEAETRLVPYKEKLST